MIIARGPALGAALQVRADEHRAPQPPQGPGENKRNEQNTSK